MNHLGTVLLGNMCEQCFEHVYIYIYTNGYIFAGPSAQSVLDSGFARPSTQGVLDPLGTDTQKQGPGPPVQNVPKKCFRSDYLKVLVNHEGSSGGSKN